MTISALQEKAEILDMLNYDQDIIIDIRSHVHCWGGSCNKSTNMYEDRIDHPYGRVCKLCNNSLRQHPFFGQYEEYDLGNSVKRKAWSTLTKFDKLKIYKKYGFK